MSDSSLHAGWTSTDDGAHVPVRSAGSTANSAHDSVVIGESVVHTMHTQKASGSTHTITEIDPRMMRLSAMTGIGIVILASALYFGVFNLRGSITDMGTTTGVTVTITEQNTFDPMSVSVPDGGAITFVNKNQNPQVLKPENADQTLFPVEVVFRDPVTVTLQSGKKGTYTYVSETMPSDQKLTIIVTPTASTSTQSQTPLQTEGTATTQDSSISIPLPFLDNSLPVTPLATEMAKSPSVEAENSTASFVATEHGTESAIISLGATASSSAPAEFSQTSVAINPYTVAEGKKNGSKQATIATTNSRQQKLHSGAPLQELQAHTPRNISSTGPEGLWLVIVLATVGLGCVYLRVLRKIYV